MSNSSLVNYTKISPNKTSPRNHAIDTITIHCVVGQCSIESLGNVFASPERGASSNYGIAKDGKIGLFVEEKDRSWCSGGTLKVNGISGSDNDHRAVTIEVASDTTDPYAVTDEAYAALIKLVADICKRNNIKELKWKGDKSLVGNVDKQNMTVHRWFANKACPGDYLYNRHGDIAAKVNAMLDVKNSSTTSNKKDNTTEVKKETKTENKEFKVKISINNLNIRKGPGTDYSKTGKFTGTGVFTITETKFGKGSDAGWGKLKSGAGWISLDFVKRV